MLDSLEDISNNDSLLRYLDFGFTTGARNDKPAFKEFDNWGGDLTASYRSMLSDAFYLRMTNSFGFRNYTTIEPRSNFNNLFTLQLGNRTSAKTNYGLLLSGGVKHFNEMVKDSTFKHLLVSIQRDTIRTPATKSN